MAWVLTDFRERGADARKSPWAWFKISVASMISNCGTAYDETVQLGRVGFDDVTVVTFVAFTVVVDYALGGFGKEVWSQETGSLMLM